MAEIIKMPLLSDTMTEGTLLAWHKKVGEKVEVGDDLFEVETDKAVMEQQSYFDGVLLHIHVEEGASVPVQSVIAVIGEEGEDFQAELAAELGKSNGATAVAEPDLPAKAVAKAPVLETQPTAPSDARVKASPLAKSMAKEAGIQLADMKGSGTRGRIVKRDIEAFIKEMAAAPVQAPTPVFAGVAGPQDIDIPLSQMRKVIAKRLGESKYSAPHFYLTVSINMDKAMDARKRINEIAPTRISFNDLVVKATAASLRMHPTINSSWLGDRIRQNGHINIGVAVAVEEGLLVPVVRNADMKTLSQINGEVREFAGKAKERKLTPDDMSGNTFTISNLGMFGIEEFTAIINPPDACILAVGGINQTAIVKDGELAIGNMMKVTMSCDHRVVDGASGAKFLQTFKEILEDPIRLLV